MRRPNDTPLCNAIGGNACQSHSGLNPGTWTPGNLSLSKGLYFIMDVEGVFKQGRLNEGLGLENYPINVGDAAAAVYGGLRASFRFRKNL